MLVFAFIGALGIGAVLGVAFALFQESDTYKRISAWNERDKEHYRTRVFGEKPKV